MAVLGNAFFYRMPAGIPGAINRPDQATIEPVALDPAHPFTAYGRFGKTSAGGLFVPLTGGETGPQITGLLVRPFPIQSSSWPNAAFLTGAPLASFGGIGDRARRGYFTVQLGFGSAAKDAPVYVCITASGNSVVGDIGDASLAANGLQVPGAYFTGPADTTNAATGPPAVVGQVEIMYNI
jgi:hypothetical protein